MSFLSKGVLEGGIGGKLFAGGETRAALAGDSRAEIIGLPPGS